MKAVEKIFYTLYQTSRKSGVVVAPELDSLVLLTLLISAAISNILFFLYLVLPFSFMDTLYTHPKEKIVAIALLIYFCLYVRFVYKDRFIQIIEKYKDEPEKVAKKRCVGIIALFGILYLLLFVLAYFNTLIK